jgi:hypothetical protein
MLHIVWESTHTGSHTSSAVDTGRLSASEPRDLRCNLKIFCQSVAKSIIRVREFVVKMISLDEAIYCAANCAETSRKTLHKPETGTVAL